jgi:predicted dehydrogenase
MSKNTISVVMLGCGNFARRYHVPTIERSDETVLAAIFDPVPSEETRKLAAENGAALVSTIDVLPRPEGRVMAIVTTPHTLHAEHVRFALEHGWHVLCDKPFVMKTQQARELAGAAEKRSLVNAVAFNRRYDPGCIAAREAIQGGAIGEVRYIETVQLGYESGGWFLDPALSGGGPYTGRATHMADLVPWLIRRSPTRLRSRLRGDGGARADRGGFIELQFGGLECHFTCIEEGWHMWDEVRIFGETGLIELRRPLIHPTGWEFDLWTAGVRSRRMEADPNPGAATRNFIAAMRDGQKVGCTFAEAVLSVDIIEQAFTSARDGSSWRELVTP